MDHSPERENAEWQRIYRIFESLQERLAEEDRLQYRLIREQLGNEFSSTWKRMTLTMFHVLQVIADQGHANGIFISSELGLTRGGVSKILKRLESLGTVVSQKREGNNKELYYSATASGLKFAAAHMAIHRALVTRMERFLSEIPPGKLLIVEEVFQKYLDTPPLSAEDIMDLPADPD